MTTPSLANASKLEVSVGTAPATETMEGYEALTWTNVTEVVSLPEFSGTRSNITFNSVTDGQKQFSGNIAQVQATVDCADVPDDAGQMMMNASYVANPPTVTYLRATFPNKSVVYVTSTIAKAALSGGFDAVAQRSYIVNVTKNTVEGRAT